jgi:hypothetical protein
MSDPRRLLDSSDSNLARALLRAGRTSAPPGARRRAIVAATSALAATSFTTTAAGGALARIGSIAALKWLGIGVASVGAVSVGVTLHEQVFAIATRHASDPVHLAAKAPVPLPMRAPHAPVASPPSAPETSAPPSASETSIAPPPVVAAPAPVRVAEQERSIRKEVAALKRASSALASGDAALALAVLQDYGARFPAGSLASEAAVLRIQALAQAGNASAARRAAESFLAAYPRSPYAERVRSVVGSNP